MLPLVQRERISVRYSGTGLPWGSDCAKIGRAFCQKAESGLVFSGVSPCACTLSITLGVCACAENVNQRHANRNNFMFKPPEKECGSNAAKLAQLRRLHRLGLDSLHASEP